MIASGGHGLLLPVTAGVDDDGMDMIERQMCGLDALSHATDGHLQLFVAAAMIGSSASTGSPSYYDFKDMIIGDHELEGSYHHDDASWLGGGWLCGYDSGSSVSSMNAMLDHPSSQLFDGSRSPIPCLPFWDIIPDEEITDPPSLVADNNIKASSPSIGALNSASYPASTPESPPPQPPPRRPSQRRSPDSSPSPVPERDGKRFYVCSECSASFPTSAKLRDHRRSHKRTRSHACKHPGCGKRFLCSQDLHRHGATHLCTDEKPFPCINNCGKMFGRVDAARRHGKLTCTKKSSS